MCTINKILKISSVALIIFLSGCSMQVKDTSGIRKYLQEQGRAEILAAVLKAKNPDTNSSSYKDAEVRFHKAAGSGNGWMQAILFDAKTKREINVSVEDYNNSDAGKYIKSFLTLEDEGAMFHSMSLGGAEIAIILPLVDFVIKKIEEQNEKQYEQAVKVIEDQFTKARWTTYELTTPQWINDKYKK